jgi:hypothetical protein
MENYIKDFVNKTKISLKEHQNSKILVLGLNKEDTENIKQSFSEKYFIETKSYIEYGTPKNNGGFDRKYSLKIGSIEND